MLESEIEGGILNGRLDGVGGAGKETTCNYFVRKMSLPGWKEGIAGLGSVPSTLELVGATVGAWETGAAEL